LTFFLLPHKNGLFCSPLREHVSHPSRAKRERGRTPF
jgi:hypothetical protein